MATWEDGPEYAPLQRPDQFTVPDVAPLQDPPADSGPPAAPADRPQFGSPENPVAPLTALVPEAAEEHRDPQAPYQVASGTMTEGGGAWGATYWRSSGQAARGQNRNASAGQGVPAGPPTDGTSAPTQAIAVSSGAALSGGNFPAPGTPGWFGPGPAPPPAPVPPPSFWKAVPVLALIALACAIFFVTAPFAFVVGFGLSMLAKYAKRQLMIAWASVGGAILLISTMSTLSNYGDLSDWFAVFRTWSLLGSLLMIILIMVIVNHEIKQPHTGPGSGQQPLTGYGPPAPGTTTSHNPAQPPATSAYPPPNVAPQPPSPTPAGPPQSPAYPPPEQSASDQRPPGQTSPGQAPPGQTPPGQGPPPQTPPGQGPSPQAPPGPGGWGQAAPGQGPPGGSTDPPRTP